MYTQFLIDSSIMLLRCILSIIILFVLTRLMGKKQISQLNFFDYIVGITIGSIASSLSVDSSIQYRHGLIGLLAWGLIPMLMSYIGIKKVKSQRFLEDKSTLLVQKGKILNNNLKEERFNVNDLMEELRLKGVFKLSDVEFAMLETNGQVSVRMKQDISTSIDSELDKPFKDECLSTYLIVDGKIIFDNLKELHIDEDWILNELKKRCITSIEKIRLAAIDTRGVLHVEER